MTTPQDRQSSPAGTGRFSLTRSLNNGAWTARVDAIGSALWRLKDPHALVTDCTMAFFDTASDTALHVNVTHRHRTQPVHGWTGPGHTANGFVYNRTFASIPTAEILRHVRDMVFAGRE